MRTVSAPTANEAYILAARELQERGSLQTSRHYQKGTTTTKELVHFGMTVEDPRQRLVFARPINPAFAIAEVIWIMSGSNDTNWIAFWNPRMKQFADKGVEYSYGAYGARLGCRPVSNSVVHLQGPRKDFDQLKSAYVALKESPISRQVVLNIYDSALDHPGSTGQPASADIPCNITSCLLVRDEKLHWLQTMRSNDFVWGAPYNFMQWMTIQEIMAGWLGLELGNYTHVVNSFHVYDNHFEELQRIADQHLKYQGSMSAYWAFPGGEWPVNHTDLRIEGYAEWAVEFQKLFDLTNEMMLIDEYNSGLTKLGILEHIEHEIPERITNAAYQEWMYLMLAECWRYKVNLPEQAMITISKTSEYYRKSWLKWVLHKGL